MQHFASMLLEQRLRTSKDRLAVRELLLARGFELPEASKPSSAISATALQIGWAQLQRNGGQSLGVAKGVQAPAAAPAHAGLQWTDTKEWLENQ